MCFYESMDVQVSAEIAISFNQLASLLILSLYLKDKIESGSEDININLSLIINVFKFKQFFICLNCGQEGN